MSKNALEQIKELLKHVQENPEALKKLEELAKSAQKDPHSHPVYSQKIIKPSDKDTVVLNPNYKKPLEKDPKAKPIFSEEILKPSKKNIPVLNPNVKKPLANAEDSKQVEMEMSPQDHEKKRVGELAKRIKACIEKMQMDKMQKESMDKDDQPHAPNTPGDKAHDVAEEGESVKQALEGLKDKSEGSKKEMLSHLRSLKDKSQLRSPENREAGKESHEKAETGHEKGVHTKEGDYKYKLPKGSNWRTSEDRMRLGQRIKSKLKIKELKEMPAPNLPKTEKAEIYDFKTKQKLANLPTAPKPSLLHYEGFNWKYDRANEVESESKKHKIKVGNKNYKGYVRRYVNGDYDVEIDHDDPPSDAYDQAWNYFENIGYMDNEGFDQKGNPIKTKKAELEKSVHGVPGKNRPLHSRGVNEPVSVSTPEFAQDAKEKSLMGLKVRRKDVSGAKDAANEIISELRAMKKPNLPKAELEKQLMSPPFSMTEKSESYYKDLVKRCWEGYEPTPGKKAYSKGSCRPVKKEELEKEQMIPVPKPKLPMPIVSGSDNGDSKKPKKPIKKPLMNSELEKEDLQAIPKKVLVEEMSGDPKEKGSLKEHSYWKTPGKEGVYPRTKFNAAASDRMRLVDMMTGKYKMHGPKGILKSEKIEYYENLIKSVINQKPKDVVKLYEKKRDKKRYKIIQSLKAKDGSYYDFPFSGPKNEQYDPKYSDVNRAVTNFESELEHESPAFGGIDSYGYGSDIFPKRSAQQVLPSAKKVTEKRNQKPKEIKTNLKDKKFAIKSEKFEYYEGLIKSVLEKAKIIAGPGREEKPGTVLGELKPNDYTAKDTEKETEALKAYSEFKHNPSKENTEKFFNTQKIKSSNKKSTKKPKANSDLEEKNKESESLGKTQKVLVNGKVMYTDRTPEGPYQVLAYKIKDRAMPRKKRKPKKTKVRKSESYYQDLIKKVLDN